MEERKVKISISGPGYSFEREIDEGTAGMIINLCLANDTQTNISANKVREIAKEHIDAKEAPAEFLARYNPKRNPDKILAFSFYLEDTRGVKSFAPDDVKALFRDASEILPANFNRDFRWTVKNGWIAAEPGKGELFYVTNTGKKVIENNFPDELVKKTAQRKGRK